MTLVNALGYQNHGKMTGMNDKNALDFHGSGLWAVILGGSSGFGLATAKRLARAGFNIIIGHKDKEGTVETVIKPHFDEIRACGVELVTHNVNLFDDEGRGEVFESIATKAGPGKVHLFMQSIAAGSCRLMIDDKTPDFRGQAIKGLAEALGLPPEKVKAAVNTAFHDKGCDALHTLADSRIPYRDEMLTQQDIERTVAMKSQTALSKEDLVAAKVQAEGQRALLDRLRRARASGRIVLDMPQNQMQSQEIPDIALEDGDQFSVPSRASTVSVMGMVYNENAFLYKPGKQVADYLQQAGGPTHTADESRIYVLRADGSVHSSEAANSLFGSIGGQTLMPGDAVIVPEQLDEVTFTRELKDWAQIFYQFALGVGAIHLLKL